ncbi:CDP-alcohol phosphatidyltransferase family protein [Corynebacterium sp. ES2794-CONJ1]|uniref:phosphatidylinositol phosphate synthase n=1 Tax=unclassified Corynebacterium TaxID=2624378 RepID=UPI002168802A|nr:MULTISPECIES: CDP-alcohol phosphatidyltransferase family protein [unclassified Corynebacterium]MCS4489216.1 CDP-alcohol phosphatidyltransferase family protein [Corynebacterium sp. ES2775-CONJ]MCS4491029.1 CDP-alcohol phosphatidyltransferase family protein [Corynebacterium sp. ES2715-CONJ3]MCS4531090.1 CDP-alcohol phosphatidyltransferase family protein [Corynebacterium sp. ES2730-CONJ]MCU9518457.1 CDP-alcohol phosphatidyltransferase family protein [Corynebacterium sp. ES2794-CONJ1]
MLSVRGRKPAAVLTEPLAKMLLQVGLTPNAVTVIGAFITIIIAVTLIPTGHLVLAAVLSALFTTFDLIDGTMARLRGSGTAFGATLDATCDRITDGVLFASITWWLIFSYEASHSLIAASFTVVIASQVISYVKARGEASGLTMDGGLIERAERLIIGLLGLGLTGLGVPWAIDIALWVLAVGSVFTVIQRLAMAKKDPRALDPIAPPTGAKL